MISSPPRSGVLSPRTPSPPIARLMVESATFPAWEGINFNVGRIAEQHVAVRSGRQGNMPGLLVPDYPLGATRLKETIPARVRWVRSHETRFVAMDRQIRRLGGMAPRFVRMAMTVAGNWYCFGGPVSPKPRQWVPRPGKPGMRTMLCNSRGCGSSRLCSAGEDQRQDN